MNEQKINFPAELALASILLLIAIIHFFHSVPTTLTHAYHALDAYIGFSALMQQK